MTPKDKPHDQKKSDLLEEICENTRAIRRVSNRILDHLHEYQTGVKADEPAYCDPDEFSWDDLDHYDDMFM